MGRQLALVRGTGDVGSAIAHLLCRNSFEIVLHDVPRPVHARRGMAFTDTLFAHADRRHQNDGSIRAPGMW